MSKNTYPLKLPTSVKKAAAELAAADGVSLNQFIAAAVAEKVGSLRAADDFLRERAGTAKPKDMLCAAHRKLHRTLTICRSAAIDKAPRYRRPRRTIRRRLAGVIGLSAVVPSCSCNLSAT
jgi:hypothetical protein